MRCVWRSFVDIGGRSNEGDIMDTIYELLLVPPYSSKLLCHMKKKRVGHGVELFGNKVLITGGKGAGTEVEIFDIVRNECVEIPPMPSPVYGMGTARRGDTMLLVGGKDIEGRASNEIIDYDFKTGHSKVIFTMKKSRFGCSSVYRENTLIVIGGTDDDFKAVYCLDFLSNSWTKLPSIAEGRLFACTVAVNMENF